MSIKLVKRAIETFLASETPEVMCLTGKWGVGKTYSWKFFLKKAKEDNKIGLSKYAYVSLFGLTSLDQLKLSIFENSIASKDVGIEPSLSTLRTNTLAAVKVLGRQSVSILERLPWAKNFADAFNSVSFLSVTGTIVCLDDLERRGQALQMKEVLGLVSYLKEQRGCKVVLIFNEDVFKEEEATEFKRYVEKVADYNIEFAPSAEDSLRIALPDPTDIGRWISKGCVSLKISNIRLIKRMARLASQTAPILKDFDPRILEAIIKTLVLLVWCTYATEEGAPTIAFLKSRRFQSWMGSLKQQDLSSEEQGWNRLLDEYGFSRMEQIDLILLAGIQKGYFDDEGISSYGAAEHAKIKAARGQNEFSKAWELFHGSFKNNDEEVVAALYSSFKKNVQFIDPANASAVVSLLRELGQTDKAKELIQCYVRERNDERQFFDMSQYPFSDLITDQELNTALSQKFKSFKDDRSPNDILKQLASGGGWSAEDIVLLEKLSADDFYKLFMATEGDELLRLVHGSLTFRNIGNAGPELKGISNRAVEALVRIGKQSKLNARRLAKFKINV